MLDRLPPEFRRDPHRSMPPVRENSQFIFLFLLAFPIIFPFLFKF